MTANEIRAHSVETFEKIRAGLLNDNNVESAKVSALCHIMLGIWEIAARLAEAAEVPREKERK